ncbi:MAG: phosphoglucosamine mutase [Gammaproteobacteria bacterium]|nr:phosphoglucosamine mutase [Gammaproteobacteria bacterium]
MSRKYFGTDGVRGRVGQPPLTVDFVLRLASAAARVLAPEGGSVLIGKDTRLSGYMFEAALEAGFVAAGVDVMLIGPLPTPGVAHMTRHFGCKFGVVISGSHNPYHDNGIKFFDGAGGKLSDEEEVRIEAELENLLITRESKELGRATRVDKARKVYQEFCISTMAPGTSLAGMKIVIDCAHGAGYKVGPRILADLGAEIVPLGCSPNGRNINQHCGSTAPELLQLTVPGVRAQVGIALDGDGDRLVMVDHLGRKVDGDQLLYVIATHRHATGRLRGPVVGTLMTNYGLERALSDRGIEFHRAQVGDRYVLAKLRETGGVLGGETSGHLLTLDYATTGDAMVVALQVLSIMRETCKTLAELTAELTLLPQTMVNIKVSLRFDPLAVTAVRDAMRSVEQRLAGRGRVVLRGSGTEPLIRIMIESEDGAEAKVLANELAEVVRAAAAQS